MQSIKTTKTTTIEIKPTPQDLARLWWSMDSFEMAIFFEAVASIIDREDKPSSLSFQMEFLSKEKTLGSGGRSVMSKIGEYANHNFKD